MGAVISECGKYRYSLTRDVGQNDKVLTFIMLNPSTADAEQDDPTIKKCRGFCQRLGYGKMQVVNLFSFRATDPKNLRKAIDPIGPKNLDFVKAVAVMSDLLIAAWGVNGSFGRQDEKVIAAISGIDIFALELTKDRHPKHPLYISYEAVPILFKERVL